MKFRYIFFLFILVFISSCEQYNGKSKKVNFKPEIKYRNTGFALIYNESLDLKKLDQRSLEIFHKSLKKKIPSKNYKSFKWKIFDS